jgi:GTPase involved in cell partitioning and DNA repair
MDRFRNQTLGDGKQGQGGDLIINRHENKHEQLEMRNKTNINANTGTKQRK